MHIHVNIEYSELSARNIVKNKCFKRLVRHSAPDSH